NNARKANGSRWTPAVESIFCNRLIWCDTSHIHLQPSTIAADRRAARSADKRDRARLARRRYIRIVKEEPVSARPNPVRSSRGYHRSPKLDGLRQNHNSRSQREAPHRCDKATA